MLDSARGLFVSQGFSNTTMADIAEAADVAVQTLYYTFQTKGKLLIEVTEDAGGAGDPLPVPQRAWFREMMSSQDPQRILALAIDHGSGIYKRVAGLWPAIDEAMSDADVAEYWARVTAGRERGQRIQAEKIADMGALKSGLTADRAGDLIVLLTGHGPYRSLVLGAGWPMVEYKAWVFKTLVRQLLDTPIDSEAVADLSFAGEL